MTPSTERVWLYVTIFLITVNLAPTLLYDQVVPPIYDITVICLTSMIMSAGFLVTYQITIFILMAMWHSHADYCDERVDLVASYRNQ